ncbi:MAG: hypothetical protein A3A08_01405 [Candidatus Nealsonbacteria bacterium RIFCSPLOWO2_01_FULL_41_9]|uniref:Uncharacterized protein n=1 Tax=Candidatus Nealsonbacteria bacterium RIFCSPLOWO2_01_FULL_41_9 TaxID=1801671 RepID=A0A1G2EE39_9BACT|nr:MAG: hypothetical protein A3A08_01405 [Candidatus Nealsonbacteria bacterium RIFCSPLOWO2_01_FULL_41_9]
MTYEKFISVIEMYGKRLHGAGVPKIRIDTKRTFASLKKEEILAHAHYLIDGAKELAKANNQRRMGSHLTAIQMCLSFAGWYTLQDIMDHNYDPSSNKEKSAK